VKGNFYFLCFLKKENKKIQGKCFLYFFLRPITEKGEKILLCILINYFLLLLISFHPRVIIYKLSSFSLFFVFFQEEKSIQKNLFPTLIHIILFIISTPQQQNPHPLPKNPFLSALV